VALYGPLGNTSDGAAPTFWAEIKVVNKNEIAIRVDVSLRIQNYISQALGRFVLSGRQQQTAHNARFGT